MSISRAKGLMSKPSLMPHRCTIFPEDGVLRPKHVGKWRRRADLITDCHVIIYREGTLLRVSKLELLTACCCWFKSSEIGRRVVRQIVTDVSENHNTFIFGSSSPRRVDSSWLRYTEEHNPPKRLEKLIQKQSVIFQKIWTLFIIAM